MGRHAEITLPWADGTHTFRLAWKQIIMLQEACDAGAFVILERLSNRHCRIEEISHTIRLALIGGGAAPEVALKLVQDYVEQRPPAENVVFARGLLGLACYGPGDEKPGEAHGGAAAEGRSTTSPTESSE